MKKLDKYDVFKKCGFTDHNMLCMPAITFIGYSDVINYCYNAGYNEGSNYGAASEELYKKVKDLEARNAELMKRNHELQVDNEEALREVEDYSRRCDELRETTVKFVVALDKESKKVAALTEDNTKLADALVAEHRKVIELRKANGDIARVEEYYKHNQALLQRNMSLVGELSQLRKQIRNISCTLETPPKSKFVITVEEF